ncbi:MULTISPECIES: hypothetical protein [unclassified Bradyrhizobium]|uniref:hypothetical protein n=1 Tax=unclassified Bradyrhizobium TaxID=2631580 RepID=UPI00291626B3|nr:MULTISPECIES: hypothetical protein [unclassified Bradyrhizobium]
MSIRQSFVVSFVLATAAAAAHAQAPPTPATPPQATAPAPAPDQNAACAPNVRAMPTPDGITTGQSGEPLGEKLAKTNGVLCPPSGVDPQMHAPTPEGGTTPVIPPPGSPGGNPNVQPK